MVHQKLPQAKDDRKYLLIPVAALRVVGFLLELDDPAVLLKDRLGKQDDKRPEGWINPGTGGLRIIMRPMLWLALCRRSVGA